MPNKKSSEETVKVGVELGASGTNIFQGVIYDEYNTKLEGANAISTYDEMRKSDATVKAALLAVQLPIRRAKWYVQPASDDEKDVAIARFVENCLFNLMSITWDDFLRQALLMTAYGVMVFEKVFEVRNIDGQDMIVWKKLASRLPSSILKWETENGGDGITQVTVNGHKASIPIEKLLVFVNDKEGDNWWGISMIRAAYRSWYMKKTFEDIDAVATERHGVGVPKAKTEKTLSTEEKNRAIDILSNVRSHESSYIIEPPDIEVKFMEMGSGNIKDAGRAIEYHDRQILKAVLAQFLALGASITGSRALSEDHSDLFLQSLEAVSNSIKDVINKYAIKQLVDLNFDNVQAYPELLSAGIARTDVNNITTSYQRLVQSGGIKPIKADEQYLREIMGLPARTEEDEVVEVTKKDVNDEEEVSKDLGLSEHYHKNRLSLQDARKAIDKKTELMTNAEKVRYLKNTITRIRETCSFSDFFRGLDKVLSAQYSEATKNQFKEQNTYKSWRKLTFAEQKIDFTGIEDYLNNAEGAFITQSAEILERARAEYMRRLTNAINNDKIGDIKDITMPYQNEYQASIKNALKDAYNFGKQGAAREMGINAAGTPSEVIKNIDLAASTIADTHYTEITQSAKTAVTDRLSRNLGKVAAISAADAAMAGAIQKLARDTSTIVVSGFLNSGRGSVFEANSDKIYALQRSEILDAATCNFCMSVDGRIVDMKDPIASFGSFHSNCRGIWVEILKDEEELPSIGGIPQSIRDRLGDSVNELVQPPQPTVRKDSPAAAALAKLNK